MKSSKEKDTTDFHSKLLRKQGFKLCRIDKHSFTLHNEVICRHKHCSRCGVCQCTNGCLQIFKKVTK